MTGRLEGKIAIVTGGSRGIGKAIGAAMLREGARVVLASRRIEGVEAAAAEIGADHPDAVFAKACHVGKPEQIAELVAWVSERVGLPDVLVNNAGTNPFFGPLLQIPEAAFDKTFEVNLKSAWHLSRAVAKGLIAAKRGGSIINIASVLGMRAAPLQGCYGMTKAALISFTQTLAVELGTAGVRVNAIAPGLVETRLAAIITADESLTRAFTDRTALERAATPDEIAGLAVYLASDEASYVTGQSIPVDGGFTIR